MFFGQHVTMNRRVALKIVSKELSRDPAHGTIPFRSPRPGPRWIIPILFRPIASTTKATITTW